MNIETGGRDRAAATIEKTGTEKGNREGWNNEGREMEFNMFLKWLVNNLQASTPHFLNFIYHTRINRHTPLPTRPSNTAQNYEDTKTKSIKLSKPHTVSERIQDCRME